MPDPNPASTPPQADRAFEFQVVIDGQLPGRIDIQRAQSIEQAQQALQARYGDRAQVTFRFVVPDWRPEHGHTWYILPTESQPTQVYCDGYDAYQAEPTHPGVYYTTKQGSDGVYRAACHYCGRKWVTAG